MKNPGGVLWGAFLLPILAGCSTAPVSSEFGDAGSFPSRRARGAVPRGLLDCGDPRAIRDLKDTVLGSLYPDLAVAEAWPACPAYDTQDAAGSLAETRDWFRAHLPVDEEQAKILAGCIYAH